MYQIDNPSYIQKTMIGLKKWKKKHANFKKKQQLLTGTVNAFLFTDRSMLEKKIPHKTV